MSANDTPIDDEELLALAKTLCHPSGKPNAQAIADASGRSRGGIQRALIRLARNGRLGTAAVLPGFGIKQTSEQLDESGAVQKTWIKQAPVGDVFEVPEGHSVKGISALVDASGATVQQWIKTSNDEAEVAKEAILEAFKAYRGRAELIPAPIECDDSLLTLYGVADLHLGMQAWGRETGANWDLKIARSTILSALGELIGCAPKSAIAVILDLGDFTHNNDQSNATPASRNQLDVDCRFPKIAREAVKISIEMTELALQKHDRVILRFLPGNHDPEAAQWISIALSLFFEKNPRVIVDADPSDFWFYRHGKVMLAANHGHKMKPEDLPGVMASYRPDDWGKTRFRYGFSGHVHHIRAGEKHGAKWETFRTVAARDAYAHQHGYSAGRELVSITYHADRGERMRQTISV